MSNTNEQDSKSIKIMLEVLLKTIREDSMIEWVSEVAVGQNNGGAYISLYQQPFKTGSYLKGRFCTAYEQDWYKLPPAVVEEAKKRLPKTRVSKAVNDRDEDRKEGLAWEIDPIKAIRFQYTADEKTLYRMYAYTDTYKRQAPVAQPVKQEVKSVAQPTPPPKSTQAQPLPTFLSRDAALQWSLDQKAYSQLAIAEADYESLKKRISDKYKPFTASHMFGEWISHVKTVKQAVERGLLTEV